jgi:F-type H+-transporting ATPase subunit epsilon
VRLLVTTPTELIVDEAEVLHVRAEDETGAFGIQPGHADFLTVLAISVISWRPTAGDTCHVAVRGGVLTVRNGDLVEVATRDAVREESLERLRGAVLDEFRAQHEKEAEARVSDARLHMATMRQLQRFLDSRRTSRPMGGPPKLDGSSAFGMNGSTNGNRDDT